MTARFPACGLNNVKGERTRPGTLPPATRRGPETHEHPLVAPQVLHFMQVPLRTSVKFPHSPQASPS